MKVQYLIPEGICAIPFEYDMLIDVFFKTEIRIVLGNGFAVTNWLFEVTI